MIQLIKTSIICIFIAFIDFSGAHAQDFSAGGGLSYGTVAKNIGLNFRGDVQFDRKWSIAPHFNWFFNTKSDGITKRWNALNIDGHYYFELENLWRIYPVVGINFATVSQKVNDIKYSNSDIGINMGFGSEYLFDPRFSGFGEIKYVISNADQVVISLGVLYQIGK